MNAKTLTTLGVATIAIASLAYVAVRKDTSATAAISIRQSLFPELSKNINDVTSLVITTKDEQFTIEKEGDGWGLADKGGYPVDGSKVRQAVIGVSRLETLEAKTKSSERHADLGVEAIGADAASTRLELRGKDGNLLASVILGKQRPARGSGDRSMYVRRTDEDQAWEVLGDLSIDGVPINWLDKSILKIPGERMKRAEINHPDGERLVVFKENSEDAHFTVADMPEGAELKWEGIATSIGRSLSFLNMEDVRPLDDVDFTTPTGPTVEFRTFDGLIVTVYLTEFEDATYAKLTTDVDPVVLEELAAEAEAIEAAITAASDAAASAEGDEGLPPVIPSPLEVTAGDIRAEAEELGGRLAAWTFALPAYSAANFDKRMQDLLKEEEEPEEAEPVPVIQIPDDFPALDLSTIDEAEDSEQPELDLGEDEPTSRPVDD